jgi:hypothetical protein
MVLAFPLNCPHFTPSMYHAMCVGSQSKPNLTKSVE